MAESAAPFEHSDPLAARGLIPAVAWRNLWRNARRTWLTAGGIGFAIALVVVGMAFQVGGYAQGIENGTALFSGHIQVQHRAYPDDARFEHTIENVSPLLQKLDEQPELVSVAPRVQAFALASTDERSFGAQVLGVDLQRENRTVRFFDKVAAGRNIGSGSEATVGEALARNLNAEIGDELVVLGTGKEGGVAAMALQIVGIFSSGIAELDRAMIVVPIDEAQSAFGLGDEAHTLVIRAARPAQSAQFVERLNGLLPEPLLARNWDVVLPDLKQGIEIDRIGGYFMYGILILVVTFSIVNSFIMTVFERTREFGMLRAIGMRPGKIVLMVQLEAVCVWLLGTLVGLLVAVPIVAWFARHGVYLGDELTEMMESMYIPDRLHPELSGGVLIIAPAIMLIGTQIASLIPSLRIRRLQPVVALRAD